MPCRLMGARSLESIYKEFLARFPENRTEHRCFVDEEDGDLGCVLDEEDDFLTCTMACHGMKKEDCEQWKETTVQNVYDAQDLWKWINSMLRGQNETSEIETSSHGKVRLAPKDMQRHECCACLELFTPWQDGDEMNTDLCRACSPKGDDDESKA